MGRIMINNNIVDFTYLRSNTLLTKSFKLEDNEIKTEVAAHYSKGTAYHQRLEFAKLPERLAEMGSTEAITSGVIPKSLQSQVDGVACVRVKAVKESMIARSKVYINHENNSGNGLVILDIDEPPGGRIIIPPRQLYAILCVLIPGFDQVACFSRGSSSSRIKALGKSGYRFYILTNTPSGIAQFMDTLHQKLWVIDLAENELGYIALAKNGNYLERSVIDLSMKSPHQLDFCGKPHVSAGIEVNNPDVTWYGTERALDYRELAPLTEEEKRIYKNRVQASKKRLKREVERVRHLFEKSKRDEFKTVELKKLADANLDFKVTDQLLSELDNQFDNECNLSSFNQKRGELHPAFVLHFNDGRSVTVADVIKDPEAFDDCALADPVEGVNYSSGTQCAIFYSNGNRGKGTLYIHSMAHGGCKYFLTLIRPAFSDLPVLANEEAKKRLRDSIEGAFNQVNGVSNLALCPVNTVIRGTMGIGKTDSIFSVAEQKKQEGKQYLIHLYVQNHKVAEDILSNMEKRYSSLSIGIQKGRGMDNCAQFDVIDKSDCSSIMKSFCDDGEGQRCKFFEECPYMQQFSRKVDVLILPHSFLRFNLMDKEQRPDLVVIDERYFSTVTSHESFQSDDLAGILSPAEVSDFKALLQSLSHSQNQVIPALIQHFGGSDTVNKLQKYLRNCTDIETKNEINPLDRTEKKLEKVCNLKMINKRSQQLIYTLLILIKPSIFGSRERNISVIKNELTLHYPVCLIEGVFTNRYTDFINSINEAVPIICIDGDADEEVAKALLGDDINFIRVDAQRNLHVTQCNTRTLGKKSVSGLDNSTQKWSVDIINRTANTNAAVYGVRTLLVTYLELHKNKAFMKLLSAHIDVEHFGAIRGLDCYKQHHAIIFGRNQPPSDSIVIMAISLFGKRLRGDTNLSYVDVSKIDNFESQPACYRGVGKGRGRYFDNENLNRVMAQFRESETVQAIARVRDVWSDTQKRILVLDALPIDVNVDRTLSWAELAPKEAAQSIIGVFEENDGILIKSPRCLSESNPELTKDQWKEALKLKTKILQLPMGEYEAGIIAKAEAGGKKIKGAQVFEQLGHTRLKIGNTTTSVIYDVARHTDNEVLKWAEDKYGDKFNAICKA